jgi:nucleoside-diphosphate-sugar epimerase
MSKQKIAITGASGFIGAYLVKYFSNLGYVVTGFVRTLPSNPVKGVLYKKFFLDETLDENEFTDTDCLIHCAYVKNSDNKNSEVINIRGTQKLIDISRKCSIKKFVFLSSLSAHEKAESAYGKSKYRLESLFDLNHDLVLKPGLVLGKGGLFYSIVDIIKKSKFIPMIDGGYQKMQYIYIEDLAYCIEQAIENNMTGLYPLANQVPIVMKTFYREISEGLSKECYFIYFPFFLANILFTLFDFLHLPLSLSKENLLGLKNIQYIDVNQSLHEFNIKPLSFKESVKKILQ